MTASQERDVDEIIARAAEHFIRMRGMRLYVTGGTGFFGRWLARAIMHANRKLGTGIRVEILSRNPEALEAAAPDIYHDASIRLVRGEISKPPADGAYDGVIHAATEASAALNRDHPDRMLEVIFDGMRALIDTVIAPSGRIPVLFTSSGAVYGRQPPELERVPESYAGAPDCLDTGSAYHEGKRLAELLLSIAAKRGYGEPRVARLFAFVGPGLPLDIHFAAGNFVRDALERKSITVQGDGRPVRSYLYPTDMISWCVAVFASGVPGRAYNVGSPESVSIGELASRISRSVSPAVPVAILGTGDESQPVHRYVPDTTRIEVELGVQVTVPLDRAIARTVAHYR